MNNTSLNTTIVNGNVHVCNIQINKSKEIQGRKLNRFFYQNSKSDTLKIPVE